MNSRAKTELALAIAQLCILGVFGYFSVKWLVKAMDPTRKAKEDAKKSAMKLMSHLGIMDMELSEYELSIATQLVDTRLLEIAWTDIGGLDETIEDITETVIIPFKNRHFLPSSSLLCPPKGALLYGPPGCGKTMIAKATAKAAGCRFICLEVSSLLDKWYGESQKLASALFSFAYKIQPCLIFIDEIDSFLRARHSQDHEATAMMKAQFMSLWDGLLSDASANVIIIGATNRPNDVDKAILRRMPCRFYIGLPNVAQREAIVKVIIGNEKVALDFDLRELAEKTEGFSGSDLRELCRLAALHSIKTIDSSSFSADERWSHGKLINRPITMENFAYAIHKMKSESNVIDFS